MKNIYLLLGILFLIGSVSSTENWSSWNIAYGNISSYAGGDEVIGRDVIDINSEGEICLLWEESGSKNLIYNCVECDESGCIAHDEDYQVWTATPGTEPYILDYSLILDNNDWPYVCYVTGDGINNFLRFGRIGKLGIFNETNFTDTRVETCDIALDQFNAPHIVYKEAIDNKVHEYFEFCGGGSSNCGEWTDSDTIGNQFTAGGIDFKGSGEKVIVTTRFVAGAPSDYAYIYEAEYDNINVDAGDVIYTHLVGTSSFGDYCDMVFDENNNLYYSADHFSSTNFTLVKNNLTLGSYDGECPSLDDSEDLIFGYYQDSGNIYEFYISSGVISTPDLKFISAKTYPVSMVIDDGFLYVAYTYDWDGKSLVRIAKKQIETPAGDCFCNAIPCNCESYLHLTSFNESFDILPRCNVTLDYNYGGTLRERVETSTDENGSLVHAIRHAGIDFELDITVSKPGYYNAEGTIYQILCNQDYYKTARLWRKERSHNLEIQFWDSKTGDPLKDVNVICDAYGNNSCEHLKVSNTNGYVNYTGLNTGFYFFYFTKAGYQEENSQTAYWLKRDTYLSYQLVNISQTYDVNVRVISLNNSENLSDIRVEHYYQGSLIDLRFTNANGTVRYEDQFFGSHSFTAIDESNVYGSKTKSIILDEDETDVLIKLNFTGITYLNEFCFYSEESEAGGGGGGGAGSLAFGDDLFPILGVTFNLYRSDSSNKDNRTHIGEYTTQYNSNCKIVRVNEGDAVHYTAVLIPDMYGYKKNEYVLYLNSEHLQSTGNEHEIILERESNLIGIEIKVSLVSDHSTGVEGASVVLKDCEGGVLKSRYTNALFITNFDVIKGNCYFICASSSSHAEACLENIKPSYDGQLYNIYLGIDQKGIIEQFVYWILYFWWLYLAVIILFYVVGAVDMVRYLFGG